ncbi:AHH domain-containing protein [Microbulbifer sp. ZKSA002]|uniref:AHH domain-containing protein n=1 Tax=Microbulbifer sp. ZKSA002 TaxID=3243388 RepID=UPI002B2BF52D|nr:AHH domain-containing protein [Microbulbifer sp. MKSA007]
MIQDYEQKAEKFYSGGNAVNSLDKERKAEREKALKYLDQERRTIEAMMDVQEQLAKYRAVGEGALSGTLKERTDTLQVMEKEKHHPTDTLEKYMRAEGVPKPSPLHTAHHIVPGKGKLPVVTGRARMHLHRHGIRINDPANGVYLVRRDDDTPHWSMPESTGHLTYHTHEYERWVARRIQGFRDMDTIKTQLQVIGRILQENEPDTAITEIKNGVI